jgi:hypothetical protein
MADPQKDPRDRIRGGEKKERVQEEDRGRSMDARRRLPSTGRHGVAAPARLYSARISDWSRPSR